MRNLGNYKRNNLLLVFLCQYFIVSHGFEPFSSTFYFGASIGLSTVYASWNHIKCYFYECCMNKWNNMNLTALDVAFTEKLHGQPLVRNIIIRSLKGHLKNKEPKKSLVFSFHGWTGSGKNFVSKLIAESLYPKGMRSDFVHIFISTRDFQFQDQVDIYKKKLQDKIKAAVQACEYSLFIFDEIDKMPPGIIDTLKPFIDYHEPLNGIDYRKAIYIFLSNTGGKEITKVTYQFWKEGKERNQITMKDIEPLISRGAFNDKGGLYRSEIIERHLIDVHVPFLPLEKSHVKLCARDDMLKKGYKFDMNVIDQVANEMEYEPVDIELYSVSGCKKVSQKVDLFGVEEDIAEL